MLRDITLGQYYPKDSVIHRLDPRVKITAVLVYIVMLFLVRDFTGYGVSLLAVIAVTAGDPAGIGPELAVRAAADPRFAGRVKFRL